MKLLVLLNAAIRTWFTKVQNQLSKKQFLLLSAILVGLSAGLVAVLLKRFVHIIFDFVTKSHLSDYNWFYLSLPALGILISLIIIQTVFKGKIKKGVSQVHYSLAKRSSFMPRRNMIDQFLTSSFTVGFGGSTGLEAPIVITGAAFGSNFAKTYSLNYKERTLLLSCGIAAGIAAAFNAPIAGVLFALEVLLVDISITSFTLLILAAATGALISKILLNEGILLNFILSEGFNYWNIHYYLLLGILSGIVAVYHGRIFSKIEQIVTFKFKKLWKRWLFSMFIFALLIGLFPPLFGEGYQSLKVLASSDSYRIMDGSFMLWFGSNEFIFLLFVGLIVFIKSIAAALTIAGGGNGGNFAPSLFIGAYLGFFLSKAINYFKIDTISTTNFMMVGMAGILSGLYHSPLTAIFLIAEITGGYSLMIPLMLVSSISFVIARYYEPFPMDSKSLIKKGEAYTTDKDKNVLTSINLSDFVEVNFDKINPEMSLRELVDVVSHSKRNVFPVIGEDEEFLGLVLLDDIREIMFNTNMYDKSFVKDYMRRPLARIGVTENMSEVMKKFDQTGAWILPVLNKDKYIGFAVKTSIFTGYRKKLKEINLS